MSKYYGAIGYGLQVETVPGVYEDDITERNYYGDILELSRRFDSGENLNDDIQLKKRVSIVADAYAYDNFMEIRYIVVMGKKWKVSDVDVQPPRLILTLGGLYHGDEA